MTPSTFEEEALINSATALRTTAGGAMRKAKETGDDALYRKAVDVYHAARLITDYLRGGRE